MPAFTDHYKNSRQNQAQLRNSSSLSLSSNAAAAVGSATAIAITGGGNTFSSSRNRIYPREYTGRHSALKSPHLSNATSPLLNALQNPSDLLPRSIPFTNFLSSSSPSSGGQNSLGSAPGGVGLGVGVSPPPSAPASYSSGGGFGSNGAPRQVRGYPGFDEKYTSQGGYYNPTQRYAYSPPLPLNGQPLGGSQLQPGEGDYACSFDTLDEPGFGGGNGATSVGAGGENVMCLGWQDGVDVWRVGRGVVEQVGRLDGLGGAVKCAKILPTPPGNDPLAAQRPLICLVVHSPVSPNPSSHPDRPPPIIMGTDTPYSSSPPSRPPTPSSNRSASQQSSAQPTEWQTTVEVWSLSMRTKVANLFTSPIVPTADFSIAIGGAPAAWGGIRIEAVGDKIVVGVGLSGEAYIFGLESAVEMTSKKVSREDAEWKCLGKVWTSVQPPSATGSFSSDSGINGNGIGLEGKLANLHNSLIGTPVFSLSDRWLAYCPAPAGSAISAGGEVDVPCNSLSIKSQIPPPQPSISISVSLEDEAFLNRMAREVTQEVIRGAKWATEAGLKALQNYWNGGQNGGSSPPPAPPLPISTNGGLYGMSNGSMTSLQGGPPQPSGLGQQVRQMQQMGGTPQQQTQFFSNPIQNQSTNEPRLVSILDLAKISNSGAGNGGGGQQNLNPMATFLPPAGVSFLSFAPGGLALLTASSKGDLLFVWDLMRAIHYPPGSTPGHHKSASVSSPDPASHAASGISGADGGLGKHVRQIARFARMTVATIVDVSWSSPRGEKLAVVTEKGTVHFYDLPGSAYQWPPPRRPPPSSSAVNGTQGGAAGAAVSGAVNLLNSSTQPLLTAARRRRSRSNSIGSPSGGIFMNYAGSGLSAGRKAVTGGGGSGSGSGSPNEPTWGSKISLPQGVGNTTAGCARFLIGKERGYVAVMGGGVLRIYEVRPGGGGSGGTKKRKTGGGIVLVNWLEYELPLLPDTPSSPKPSNEVQKTSSLTGFWSGRQYHNAGRIEEQTKYDQHPLSFAEIETNAVFPPFHTDRHVRLFVYADSGSSNQLPQKHPQRGNDWQHDERRQDMQHRRRAQKVRSSSPSPSPNRNAGAKTQTDVWVFGLPLPAKKLNIGSARGEVEFAGGDEAGLVEAMESELMQMAIQEAAAAKNGGRRVSKKGKKAKFINAGAEGFFEDDCEFLEFANGT